jgi:predicted ATPase
MLTQMRFTNWRSLRDVTIENLTPITVFIGANSTGKSNILDALHFVRYAENAGGSEAAFVWRMKEKVRTLGVTIGSPVELELTYTFSDQDSTATKTTTMLHKYAVSFQEDVTTVGLEKTWRGPFLSDEAEERLHAKVSSFVKLRWQLLREGFSPPPTLGADAKPGPDGLYIIEPSAQNVPLILNFMQQMQPDIYRQLEADLQQLLGYVSQLGTISDDKETRYFVEERSSLGHESPTISGGTARMLAILTAYYALDMRSPDLPGLVAIEEPDNAVHPLLLGNLVDLLRSYVDRKEPRQFILTTHNPQMLNYFQPEEVRVVERDPDTGETFVGRVPDYIRETWLTKHQLGEAWTSRVIGGIPEE